VEIGKVDEVEMNTKCVADYILTELRFKSKLSLLYQNMRVRTMNKMDKCRLCGQMKELCNSHIIPEFFYKPIYDRLHRLHMIPTSPDEKNSYKQKGIKEKLLCLDCEQFFCKFEKYVSQVFNGGVDIRISRTTTEIIIEDIDYHLFKMFHLSILWRMGVATDKSFSEVQLGPYEAVIRNMLLKDTPGEPYECGCIMCLLM